MNIFVESYGLGYETTREQREEKKKRNSLCSRISKELVS